jgi:flagellar biosynthesis protein FlhG
MEDTGRHSSIWAIGGGKGGTGKSFVTSCMGTHLALNGHKTLLLDADLGGANLHTFFGLNKPRLSLADFFEKKVVLHDIIVQSGINNLKLILGSGESLDSKSINHAQKQKLFRHIQNLNADTIIIDLGAGTHINTLDTFLQADKMIVVTAPEITALENLYQFIKSVFYRKLKSITKTYGLTTTVQEAWDNRASYNIRSPKEFMLHLKRSSDHMREIFEREMSGFVIHIVVNQVRTPQDIHVGENMKSLCLNVLGLPAVYVGYSSYDEEVRKSINSREPFMLFHRLSPVGVEIRALTHNIVTGTHFSIQKDVLNGRQS